MSLKTPTPESRPFSPKLQEFITDIMQKGHKMEWFVEHFPDAANIRVRVDFADFGKVLHVSLTIEGPGIALMPADSPFMFGLKGRDE